MMDLFFFWALQDLQSIIDLNETRKVFHEVIKLSEYDNPSHYKENKVAS